MLIKSSNRVGSHSSCERENDDPSTASRTDDNEDLLDSERECIDKLDAYSAQLRQLDDRTHPEFFKASKRIENWLGEQKLRNQILHDHRIDEIHRQYELEIRTCDRDCAAEKKRIQEYLIGLCEDLKRRLEHDKKSIELTTTGDVLELKPTVTRKLRRRAPDGPSSIVGSGIMSSTGGRFGYWGDLSLYTSSWSTATLNGSSKAGLELPPSPSCFNIVTGQENTEEILPNTTAPSNSTFGNLFGSLGVNVEDGNSLLTHLIASLSASNAIGNGNSDLGILSASNAFFGQSAFVSSLGSICAAGSNSPSMTSVAAAIVPSLTGLTGPQPSKRRKQQNNQPLTQLSLLLPETDIYSDLTIIHRTCGKPLSSTAGKKHGHEASVSSVRGGAGSNSPLCSTGTRGEEVYSRRRGEITEGSRRDQHHHHHHHDCETNATTPLIWIDDGRLYVGQSCYQQGTPVYLESHGCNGTVVSVGAQDISIKRSSDTGIMRITVQQLKLGRYVLAPLKPRQ